MSDMTKPKEAREWLSDWMRYAKGEPVEGVPNSRGNHADYVLGVLEKAAESHKKNLQSMTTSYGRHDARTIASYAASIKRIDKAIPQVRKLALAQEKAERDYEAKREAAAVAYHERLLREHPARSHGRSVFVGDGVRPSLPPGTTKG